MFHRHPIRGIRLLLRGLLHRYTCHRLHFRIGRYILKWSQAVFLFSSLQNKSIDQADKKLDRKFAKLKNGGSGHENEISVYFISRFYGRNGIGSQYRLGSTSLPTGLSLGCTHRKMCDQPTTLSSWRPLGWSCNQVRAQCSGFPPGYPLGWTYWKMYTHPAALSSRKSLESTFEAMCSQLNDFYR